MSNRLDLQATFEKILGSRNVYFQPPMSVKLNYPAIVYAIKDVETTFADNRAYLKAPSYEVTLIDKNPDNVFIEAILDIPYCTFDRHYKADNLNHYVFTLFH